jgi:glycosyltransferase involved in cell wall biosynthesis
VNALPPLVAHVLLRFDTGGLENGVVNLINHMPRGAYRHMVVALTEVTDFRHRLHRDDVECVALHKGPGHGAKVYPRLWGLLRERRPAIVHTRNLAALEMQPAAWAAGVPVRIHGEHGRDVDDLDGSSLRHQRLRRLYAPFVQRWVALSKDLAGSLTGPVGVPAGRVHQIYNGVNAERFQPALQRAGPERAEPKGSGFTSADQEHAGPDRAAITGCPFAAPAHWLVGTVGRMASVKNQTLLAQAFVRALQLNPAFGGRARLVMVGDGPLRGRVQAVLDAAGAGHLAWLPGERADVPDVMRALDCFVLPSLAEGISNTILEAMACSLPVVATSVGGNVELVVDGLTGALVASGDVDAMARALIALAQEPRRAALMGQAGRERVDRMFSMPAMVDAYRQLYDSQLANTRL